MVCGGDRHRRLMFVNNILYLAIYPVGRTLNQAVKNENNVDKIHKSAR
jgi:hypothetical protein